MRRARSLFLTVWLVGLAAVMLAFTLRSGDNAYLYVMFAGILVGIAGLAYALSLVDAGPRGARIARAVLMAVAVVGGLLLLFGVVITPFQGYATPWPFLAHLLPLLALGGAVVVARSEKREMRMRAEP